jgi:hypothetical protein
MPFGRLAQFWAGYFGVSALKGIKNYYDDVQRNPHRYTKEQITKMVMIAKDTPRFDEYYNEHGPDKTVEFIMKMTPDEYKWYFTKG